MEGKSNTELPVNAVLDLDLLAKDKYAVQREIQHSRNITLIELLGSTFLLIFAASNGPDLLYYSFSTRMLIPIPFFILFCSWTILGIRSTTELREATRNIRSQRGLYGVAQAINDYDAATHLLSRQKRTETLITGLTALQFATLSLLILLRITLF